MINYKSNSPHLLADIATDLPPIEYSAQIQAKVAEVNFDWHSPQEVMTVLKEEMAELEEAIASHDKRHIEEEFGDILFTCVNLARHLQTTVDKALSIANEKFCKRFETVETLINSQQLEFTQLSFDQLLEFWKLAKEELKNE